MKTIILTFFVLICQISISCAQNKAKDDVREIELSSSDPKLDTAFSWAKKTAYSYTNEGDPVGLWYEAALPERASFCMRDVSHQSIGAYYLGLNDYNKNMLSKFAQYISPSRVDYTSDSDFWYNLPANFDVMFSCYNLYKLSGDSDYLLAEPFYSFHRHSVNEYVKTWDSDNDGIMNGRDKTRRGIPSYSEGRPEIFIGADLPAAQAKGYNVFAEIMKLRNEPDSAVKYIELSEIIRKEYEQNWWNKSSGSFYSYKTDDGNFGGQLINFLISTILHFDLVRDVEKIERSLVQLEQGGGNVEENSYIPMVLYKFNKVETAYSKLLQMADPSVERRIYPEVSYVFVGTVAEGLMGVEPNAPENRFQTTPKLPKGLEWVEVKNIPWKAGYVTVKHTGLESTTVTSGTKQPFTWRAEFPGDQKELWVDNKKVKATISRTFNGETQVYTDVKVEPGKRYTISKSKK